MSEPREGSARGQAAGERHYVLTNVCRWRGQNQPDMDGPGVVHRSDDAAGSIHTAPHDLFRRAAADAADQLPGGSTASAAATAAASGRAGKDGESDSPPVRRRAPDGP